MFGNTSVVLKGHKQQEKHRRNVGDVLFVLFFSCMDFSSNANNAVKSKTSPCNYWTLVSLW